jgi:ABC-type lipoprotein export system ATPase subunit
MVMLELKNVKKAFVQPDGTKTPILDLAEYSLATGEQAVLIGPSGCGKTTLLHIIAGITRPTSGSVKIDGVEITRFSEATRDRLRANKLGYVFQTFNLLPAFSALENVMLGMAFSSGRASSARARDLLQRVGLGHRLSSRPKTMSVGEQQRVAVARALANRPKVLLADEPTANVDPANQQAVIDLIRENCRQEGVALLLVTHAMNVADQFERVDRLDEINRVVAAARGVA